MTAFQGCICVAGHSAFCSELLHSFAVLTASVCSSGESTGLELCTSVLELLQWKEDIQDEAELVAPLCKVLHQLLSTAGQITARTAATPSSGQTAMDISDNEAPSDEEDDADLTVAQSSRRVSQHNLPFTICGVRVSPLQAQPMWPACACRCGSIGVQSLCDHSCVIRLMCSLGVVTHAIALVCSHCVIVHVIALVCSRCVITHCIVTTCVSPTAFQFGK